MAQNSNFKKYVKKKICLLHPLLLSYRFFSLKGANHVLSNVPLLLQSVLCIYHHTHTFAKILKNNLSGDFVSLLDMLISILPARLKPH